MRPNVIVGRPAARTILRWLNEDNEVQRVPVGAELGPVDAVVEESERLPEARLHLLHSGTAEEAVAVGGTIWIAGARTRSTRVGDLVLAQGHEAESLQALEKAGNDLRSVTVEIDPVSMM